MLVNGNGDLGKEPTSMPSDERLVEVLKELVLDNWYHLAALGWAAYQDRGRGAVLLNVAKWQEALSQPPPRASIEVAFATLGDPFFEDVLREQLALDQRVEVLTAIRSTLATYDPRTEIAIFGYNKDEGYHFVFTAASKPPPPECRLG